MPVICHKPVCRPMFIDDGGSNAERRTDVSCLISASMCGDGHHLILNRHVGQLCAGKNWYHTGLSYLYHAVTLHHILL